MTSKKVENIFDFRFVDVWLCYIRLHPKSLKAATIAINNKDDEHYIQICEQLAAEKIVYG